MSYYCNKCRRFISYGEYDYSIEHFNRPLCINCQNEIKHNGVHYINSGQQSFEPIPQKPKPTTPAITLFKRLMKIGIKCELEYWDGYKHVDIAIPWAGIYVEVDGEHHRYYYDQWLADDMRDFYSAKDGFLTLGVMNSDVEKHLYEVAGWIADIARKRYYGR